MSQNPSCVLKRSDYLTIANLVFLVNYLLISLLLAYFTEDFNPSSRLPYASEENMLQISRFLVKYGIAVYVTVDKSQASIHYYLACINAYYAISLAIQVIRYTYFNQRIQVCSLFCQSMIVWVLFYTDALYLMGVREKDETDLVFLLAGGCMFFWMVYMLQYMYRKR